MDIIASAAVAVMGENAGRAGSAGFKVDVSRGERLGRVSSEWFSRPDDERFCHCRNGMVRSAPGPTGPRRGRWRAGPSGWRRGVMMARAWH